MTAVDPVSAQGGPGSPDSIAGSRANRQTLLRYSPALMLVVATIADMGRVADPDLWRHIVVGRKIIALHRIDFADPYTYSVAGHFWHNHSWLAEVIGAWFYDAGGVIALNLMKFGCSASLILFLAAAIGETGAPTLLQFAVLLTTGTLLEPFLQFRPQLFTYLLFGAMMLLLVRHNFRGRAHLWLAPPLMLVWANLHGGFVAGIAVLGVYAATCIAKDLLGGRGWRRGSALAAITLISVAATLATPYGISSWYTVIHSATSAEAKGAITEWRPLFAAMAIDWHGARGSVIFYAIALGLMASLALCFAMTPQGNDLPLVAVAGITGVAAFVALRNLPLALIAITAPLTFHARLALERLGRTRNSNVPARSSTTNQIVLSLLALIILIATGLFARRLRTSIPYPGGAVAFMDSHSLRGNILDDINWGDYLLWHAPRSKIFIDGRYETFYPASFIRQYLVFHVGQPAGLSLLGEYPHDFVLIPPDSGAAVLMRSRKDWKLIYRDENSVLYARSGSPGASIPGIPVVGKAPGSYFP